MEVLTAVIQLAEEAIKAEFIPIPIPALAFITIIMTASTNTLGLIDTPDKDTIMVKPPITKTTIRISRIQLTPQAITTTRGLPSK